MIEFFNAGMIPGWLAAGRPQKTGGIILCKSGNAVLHHNFQKWELSPGAVMTFFPNDIMHVDMFSDDFSAESLRYSHDQLRAASLQIEDVVYDWLRHDCCTVSDKVASITAATFDLLGLYSGDNTCGSFDKILLLHLKAYFLGLYDQVRLNHASELDGLVRRDRITWQFNVFMDILEKEYKAYHDVAYYAGRLAITPKHLTSITRKIAGQSAKELIDEYLVMQIKLALSETSMSIKEIAWDFNFSTFAFFCRFFARRTGMSPLRYRQSCRR